MGQAAEAIESFTGYDRDEAFRAAQHRAFTHMGSGWYGPNFTRTVKEGIEKLLAACDEYIAGPE